jgi:hypothetical protein
MVIVSLYSSAVLLFSAVGQDSAPATAAAAAVPVDSLSRIPMQHPANATIDSVVVTAPRETRNADIKQHDAVTFSSRKIERTAGAAGDISRYLSTLPSVVSSLGAKYDNTLYVRGGRPSEIMFLVDGIEFENINHFSQADGCGGPIGFINSDFIKNVRFYAQSIPVSYPGKLSSIVDIDMKSGSFSQVKGDAGIKLTGGLASFEGPVAGRFGSLALAGRYVDFSAIRTFIRDDGIPQLGDGFGKIMFLLNKNLTASATGLVSYNTYRYDYPVTLQSDNGALFANTLNEKQRIVQGGAGVYVHYKDEEIEHQLYASFSGRNGISSDSLSDYSDSFPVHQYAKNPIHTLEDNRIHYTVHTTSTIQAGKNQVLSAGVRLNDNRYDFSTSDESQRNGTCIICQGDTPVTVYWKQTPVEKTMHLEGNEFGLFGDHTLSLGPWQSSIGIRTDYFGLLGDFAASPRISEMLTLSPTAGNLMASLGLYHQFPTDLPGMVFNYLSLFTGMSTDSILRVEQRLLSQAKPLRCLQGSVGYDITPGGMSRLECDLYYKWYDQEYRFLAPDIQDMLYVKEDGSPGMRPQDGKRKAYGLELTASNARQSWYFYSLGCSVFDVKDMFSDEHWYSDWTNVGYTYSLSVGATVLRRHSFSFSVQGSGGRPYCQEILQSDCIGRLSAVLDKNSPYYSQRLQRIITTNARYCFTMRIAQMELESNVEIINLLNYKPVLEYKFNGTGFQQVTPFGITPIVGLTVRF